MTATTHAPRPGPPGRGTGWTVATDASHAAAAAATGARGWKRRFAGAGRPAGDTPIRRSFASREDALSVVDLLRAAGHSATLTEPIAGTGPKSSGMRIPPDVWVDAGRALNDHQGEHRVVVTLAPGTSRSAAVTAFLRSLAEQVSASAAHDTKRGVITVGALRDLIESAEDGQSYVRTARAAGIPVQVLHWLANYDLRAVPQRRTADQITAAPADRGVTRDDILDAVAADYSTTREWLEEHLAVGP